MDARHDRREYFRDHDGWWRDREARWHRF
jgi:hypothetical protein